MVTNFGRLPHKLHPASITCWRHHFQHELLASLAGDTVLADYQILQAVAHAALVSQIRALRCNGLRGTPDIYHAGKAGHSTAAADSLHTCEATLLVTAWPPLNSTYSSSASGGSIRDRRGTKRRLQHHNTHDHSCTGHVLLACHTTPGCHTHQFGVERVLVQAAVVLLN